MLLCLFWFSVENYEGQQFTWLLVTITQISESDGIVLELKGWTSAEQT